MTPKPHSVPSHIRAALDMLQRYDVLSADHPAVAVDDYVTGLVEQLEAAERKLAGVTSKTALDVVAEKMAAEDRARELKEQLEASLTFADHFLQWCEGVAAEEDSPIHLLVSEARALNPAKRST